MTTATKPQIDVHIRWMLRKDMEAVLSIEYEASQCPWLDEDFVRCCRQRNAIGMVVEHREQVVGFMIYELHKNQLRILNFAVHKSFRHKGVGRAMVDKLKGKLSNDRRSRISLEIRETNLDACLFFRAMDFKCVSTIRGFYEDTDEDAFAFSYRYRGDQ